MAAEQQPTAKTRHRSKGGKGRLANHAKYLDEAFTQAKKSFDEGGLPIGAVLIDSGGTVLGRGHNQRVQKASPILHGEMGLAF